MMTLEQAVIELAYENGAINMDQTEFDILEKLTQYLRAEDDAYILEVEKWVGTLNNDELMTFLAGEEQEQLEIAATGPTNVDDFFNDIFNEVL